MPGVKSLAGRERVPLSQPYLRNTLFAHHVINSWGLSVYSRGLCSSLEVRSVSTGFLWSDTDASEMSFVGCQAAGGLCRVQEKSCTFHLSSKPPNRTRNGEQNSTCYLLLDGTLYLFSNAPLRTADCVDGLNRPSEKILRQICRRYSSAGTPKNNLLAPQKKIYSVMRSIRVKYLYLLAGVIKWYSIMSQAQPNDCWILTNTETHKKYRINNAGRKVWENRLWPVEMWLYFEIIWNISVRVKKSQLT